ELACNIANSFGCAPRFQSPVYYGKNLPHINFSLDKPNPTEKYPYYSAEIGPLDKERLDTMCLIKYPEWKTKRRPIPYENRQEYGSIAEFYESTIIGMDQLVKELNGGVHQVAEFRYFYNRFGEQRIMHSGQTGLGQAKKLINLILDQGEGKSAGDSEIAQEHRNTADGYAEEWSHFRRFTSILDTKSLPPTYSGVLEPPTDDQLGRAAQQTLIKDFGTFLGTLERHFNGEPQVDFTPQMVKIGGYILTCWQRGAIPRFSPDLIA
ncbi:MAG: ferritin-like domain-containing protein, partial [Candidatus Dormibacteraceae bacterium]